MVTVNEAAAHTIYYRYIRKYARQLAIYEHLREHRFRDHKIIEDPLVFFFHESLG